MRRFESWYNVDMYLKTEGIVLARKNFGEADRIITFFTKDFGKVSVLGKGVRRPRSKKAGHLELGNWCKIFTAQGKNLNLLCEIETIKAFGIKDFSFDNANKIYHFLEIVKITTADNQRHYRLFCLLADFLKKINEEDFDLVSSCFKIKLLSSLGFFSTVQMKDNKSKEILNLMAEEDYDSVKSKVKLTSRSYLKLLAFLDSMIEDLTEQKLKTNRFLDSAF